MKKLLVDLSCANHSVGVIIPLPTGVIWPNQCGGTMCAHPQLEGIFVPLSHDCQPETKSPAYEQWRTSDPPEWAMTDDDAREMFRLAIHQAGLDHVFEVASVIPEECGEAWIPVRIAATIDQYSPLHAFAGMDAIFTYQNSD